MAQSDIKIYIGRFSPFHLGHAHVAADAASSSKLLIILIGSIGLSRSLKNPFTFEERKATIEAWYESSKRQAKLVVLPIRDYPYNNTLWQRNVQHVVTSAISSAGFSSKASVLITGAKSDDSSWYLSTFPQWKEDLIPVLHIAMNERERVRATDVRRWMFDASAGEDELSHIPDSLPTSTRTFLHEFVFTEAHASLKREYAFVEKYKRAWAVAPYPVTFTTVDALVIQSGHVLIVQRGHEPGRGLWALPGGFLNQGERLRDGAIRELMEETGIMLAHGKNAKDITRSILSGSIREERQFDHPERSARGRTITTAYLFRLDDTKPLPPVTAGSPDADAPDEILKCKWITIDEALSNTSMWFEDHHAILETLVGTKDL